MASVPNEAPLDWGPASSDLQQFLLYLGSAMTAAGEAVNEIEDHLLAIATVYGCPEARVIVLPTFVVVSLEPSGPTTMEPTAQLRGLLRLDQTSAVFDVVKTAHRGALDPAEGCRRLLAIIDMAPRFGPVTTIVGHVVLTVGICLVLQPSWVDITLAAGFGALVGVLKTLAARSLRVQMVLPVVASFAVASLTFVMAEQGWVDVDLRAMIAPLVTFLPGAALTMAVVELSAGELVTGASRLVAGSLQLVLLGFGIVAAAQAVGLPTGDALVNTPQNLLGWWAPWVGVAVFCVGVYVYNSAPRGSFPWLFLVLSVAWIGQFVGNAFFGGYVSGFVGALAMAPTARLVEQMPKGPPALVSFLPAFWLLVPGALGLIGVTEYLSDESALGLQDFLGTVGAILAIALGVLCGYPLTGSLTRLTRRWQPSPDGPDRPAR